MVVSGGGGLYPPLGIFFARTCVEIFPDSVEKGDASDFRLI